MTRTKTFLLVTALAALLVLVGTACPGNARPDKPEPPTGPVQLLVGAPGTFTARGNDPDQFRVALRFDWDDGDTTDWSRTVNNTDTVQAVHAWSVADTYYVSVQAQDPDGSSSLWSNWHQVVVIDTANRAPGTPVFDDAPESCAVNQQCEFELVATDPDGDRLRYKLFWGDGDTALTALVASGTEVSVGHAWRDTGVFTVQALARDERGGESPLSSGRDIRIFAP
jgi:hypothetical protein